MEVRKAAATRALMPEVILRVLRIQVDPLALMRHIYILRLVPKSTNRQSNVMINPRMTVLTINADL